MGGATHLRWFLILGLCWKALTLSPATEQTPTKAPGPSRRSISGADGSPHSSAIADAEAAGSAPLSRSWTSWSPWSPCSRTCGGGLAYQTRRCLRRPPRHRRVRNSKKSGRCRGPSQRYRICGVESCTPNENDDSRQEQCSAYDNTSFRGKQYVWKKFLKEPADCQLHCQPMGHRFSVTLAKLVRDGTPCSTGLDDRVCIAGSCLPVGCDGVVSSRRIADLCGVCGGDNSTCRTFSGLLTLRNLSKDYEVIAVIPRGAASLVATAEGNRLAVKEVETGRFILNGNASVWEPAGVYTGAGTRFHYQNHTGTQSLTARGPLARPVQLMLVFRSPNLGVKFQYSVSSRVANKGAPPSAPADEPSPGGQFLRSRAVLETGPFRWHMGFTCTKSCGTGLKQALATCVVSATGAPVPVEYCSGLPRPRTPASPSQPLPCNTHPCPTDRGGRSGAGGDMDGSPRWQVTSDWSACSVTCGEGLQRRTVVCVGLRGGALRDSACKQSGEKPPSVKPCKSRPCTVWQVGPWGKCSSECGKGMRKREVSCGPGLKDSACKASEKPATEQVCEMPPCSSTWFFSAWSECSVKCVPGVQRRRVFCVPGQNECDMLDKPSSQQPCLELCTGTWFVGPWSKCLPSCGNGTRERQVLCVGQQGGRWTTVLPDGHCGYTERPLASEPCDTPCAPEWHTSTWSTCSTSCGGRGSQTRQSLCLDVRGKAATIEECSESSRPSARRPCGLTACPAETAEERGCRDTRNRCALVVQARLCSYPYFRQGCCASCRRAASSHIPTDENRA